MHAAFTEKQVGFYFGLIGAVIEHIMNALETRLTIFRGPLHDVDALLFDEVTNRLVALSALVLVLLKDSVIDHHALAAPPKRVPVVGPHPVNVWALVLAL